MITLGKNKNKGNLIAELEEELIEKIDLNRYTPQLCCDWDKAFQLQPQCTWNHEIPRQLCCGELHFLVEVKGQFKSRDDFIELACHDFMVRRNPAATLLG